jgi:hypothetical protein
MQIENCRFRLVEKSREELSRAGFWLLVAALLELCFSIILSGFFDQGACRLIGSKLQSWQGIS